MPPEDATAARKRRRKSRRGFPEPAAENPDTEVAEEVDEVEEADAAEEGSALDEAEVLEAAREAALYANEPAEGPSYDDTLPDPASEIWNIVLHKGVQSATTKARNFVHQTTINRERWTRWCPDPPIDWIRREYGPGDYRYTVKLNNRFIKASAYPAMQGTRTFTVPEERAPQSEAPAAAAAERQLVDMSKTLLEAVTKGAGGGNDDGGLRVLAVGAATDAEIALDKATTSQNDIRQINETLILIRESITTKIGEVNRRIDGMGRDVGDVRNGLTANKTPLESAQEAAATAEALGFTREDGMKEVWAEVISVGKELVISARESKRQGKGQGGGSVQSPHSGAPTARHKQIEGGEETTYNPLGTFIVWLGDKLHRGEPVGGEHILAEAVQCVIQYPDAAAWMIEDETAHLAGDAEARKTRHAKVKALFIDAFGKDDVLVANWQKMIEPVEQFLQDFGEDYRATIKGMKADGRIDAAKYEHPKGTEYCGEDLKAAGGDSPDATGGDDSKSDDS